MCELWKKIDELLFSFFENLESEAVRDVIFLSEHHAVADVEKVTVSEYWLPTQVSGDNKNKGGIDIQVKSYHCVEKLERKVWCRAIYRRMYPWA